MKTQITHSGQYMIVSIDGQLDHETQDHLKTKLLDLLDNAYTDTTPKKIIFNLEKLEFVGSSGISNFIQTLKEFNHSTPVKPVYCNVKSEFQKFIRAFDNENGFEFYETEEKARKRVDH